MGSRSKGGSKCQRAEQVGYQSFQNCQGFLTAEGQSGRKSRFVSTRKPEFLFREPDLRLAPGLYILSGIVGENGLGREIAAGMTNYANLIDRASRVTARARIIYLMGSLALPPRPLSIRQVKESELSSNPTLRGGMLMHLDFSSRVAPSADELSFTAATGRIFIAEHPDLTEFPIGLTLLLPSDSLPVGRQQLFLGKARGWGESEFVVQYGLSTNPGGLGAARALVDACKLSAGDKRLIAYTPLVGLRARIIQIVDHHQVWQESSQGLSDADKAKLREQLADLLGWEHLPTQLEEPAGQFLRSEATTFAQGEGFRLGSFHRHLGATLIGVDHGGDFQESDSMWTRAYLEY